MNAVADGIAGHVKETLSAWEADPSEDSPTADVNNAGTCGLSDAFFGVSFFVDEDGTLLDNATFPTNRVMLAPECTPDASHGSCTKGCGVHHEAVSAGGLRGGREGHRESRNGGDTRTLGLPLWRRQGHPAHVTGILLVTLWGGNQTLLSQLARVTKTSCVFSITLWKLRRRHQRNTRRGRLSYKRMSSRCCASTRHGRIGGRTTSAYSATLSAMCETITRRATSQRCFRYCNNSMIRRIFLSPSFSSKSWRNPGLLTVIDAPRRLGATVKRMCTARPAMSAALLQFSPSTKSADWIPLATTVQRVVIDFFKKNFQ